MAFPLALSPCPNDTFLFHAWIHGLVGKTLSPDPHYADIDQLNQWALEKTFPLLKISLSCLGKIAKDYLLLPVGAALGYGCGPKIIAKKLFSLKELPQKSIAVPGEETTAHLLLQTLAPSPRKKMLCPYHEITSRLQQGQVDCGLIIHESRFTFQNEGLIEVADLGELWEERFHLPLPLGGLVIHKDVPAQIVSQVISLLQESLQHGWNHPHLCKPFVQEKAQEKMWSVIQQHIDLYVTRETYALSETGEKAVRTLVACGEKMGWYPKNNFNEMMVRL